MGKPIAQEKKYMPDKQIAKKLNDFLQDLGYDFVIGERGDHLYTHCDNKISIEETKFYLLKMAETFNMQGRFTKDFHYYFYPGTKHRVSIRFNKKRFVIIHSFSH